MKTAKEVGIQKVQVMVDKSFTRIVKEMKRQGLENHIKEGWEKRQNLVDTVISNRLRSVAGKSFWNTSWDRYKIKVHPELPLNNGKKHESLQGTIDHEVIHLITLKGDNSAVFQKVCDTLNVEKFHLNKFSTMEKYKYRIICTGCGKTIARRKRKSKVVKHPNWYTSTCCGKELRSERI